MSAYFSLQIELSPNFLSKDSVDLFYKALSACGMTYLQGYRKSEGFTYNEVVAINQTYLIDPDLKDGSLYQVLFDFGGFSEVRGYWTTSDAPIFHLIIPEDDFLIYSQSPTGYSCKKNTATMDKVKEFALALWKQQEIVCIQTAWECSDVPCAAKDIQTGCFLQFEPFAIVLRSIFTQKCNSEQRLIEKDGLIIENTDNWFYM